MASLETAGAGGSREGTSPRSVPEEHQGSQTRGRRCAASGVAGKEEAARTGGSNTGQSLPDEQKKRKLEELRGRLARATPVVRALRTRAASSTSATEESSKARTARESQPARVGPAWEVLRGKVIKGVNSFDVIAEANQEKLRTQVTDSWVVHFGIECRTFSRAREIPRPGVRVRWLRSAEHPLGLAGLTRKEEESVQDANRLVQIVAWLCRLQAVQGGYTSTRSLLWQTPDMLQLRRDTSELREVMFHNCAFGGTRRKATTLWSNLPNIDSLHMVCRGKEVCDYANAPHATWGVRKVEGKDRLDTHEEARYPQQLCKELARRIFAAVLVNKRFQRPFDFSEFFSGPDAPPYAGR